MGEGLLYSKYSGEGGGVIYHGGRFTLWHRYNINFPSLRNRQEMITKGSSFYMFLMFAQIHLIFSTMYVYSIFIFILEVIYREYYMALSVSYPVSTRDTNINPRALARGMILVESWYGMWYGKNHIILCWSYT